MNPNVPYLKEITEENKNLRLPDYAYSELDIELEEYINTIRFLPDYIMEKYGVLIPYVITGNESGFEKVFNSLRKQYLYTSIWLDLLLLYRTTLRDRLEVPGKREYEYEAKKSVATFELAIAICDSDNWFNKEYLSPKNWWFSVESQLTEQVLRDSGLTGEPIGTSGNTYYQQVSDVDKRMKNYDFEPKEVCILELNPIEALEGLGWVMSRQNTNVANKYKRYTDITKSSARSLKQSCFNPVYLRQGEFYQLLRGKGWNRKKKSN